ncbi:hypothetical protein BKA70DRAFT_672041 [Coprinopsis sp. MPI-PUGE-AT-0042]|nr:hypothetical protein BKA70DRAFT_672041 [Coprinopsis sp. MPI-PUGE-AT-0042]
MLSLMNDCFLGRLFFHILCHALSIQGPVSAFSYLVLHHIICFQLFHRALHTHSLLCLLYAFPHTLLYSAFSSYDRFHTDRSCGP